MIRPQGSPTSARRIRGCGSINHLARTPEACCLSTRGETFHEHARRIRHSVRSTRTQAKRRPGNGRRLCAAALVLGWPARHPLVAPSTRRFVPGRESHACAVTHSEVVHHPLKRTVHSTGSIL